jgi:hypothetical protein
MPHSKASAAPRLFKWRHQIPKKGPGLKIKRGQGYLFPLPGATPAPLKQRRRMARPTAENIPGPFYDLTLAPFSGPFFEEGGVVQYALKQARQPLVCAAMRGREEGPDSIERGDG